MALSTLTPAQLREWRKARHLSQPELARRLGIGVTTLQDYERGCSRDQPPRARPIPLTVELALDGLVLRWARDPAAGPETRKTPRRREMPIDTAP